MEKFLMLVREDYRMRQQMTPEESEKSIRLMVEWVESMAKSGNYLNSEPLGNTGKYVSRDFVLSDGPFIESKEAISGYMMFLAENLEQALAMVQTCPIVTNDGSTVEVRPVGKKCAH